MKDLDTDCAAVEAAGQRCSQLRFGRRTAFASGFYDSQPQLLVRVLVLLCWIRIQKHLVDQEITVSQQRDGATIMVGVGVRQQQSIDFRDAVATKETTQVLASPRVENNDTTRVA